MRASTISLLVTYAIIALVHFGYYPKWQQELTEATISYDVSGYYLYLPAAFIYQDLKEVKFLDEVMVKYRPTASPYQVFTHASGNKVMKYSIGQAVVYAPWFAIGHVWAKASDQYPADGFSRPYQFMVSFGSLIISFVGLYWLTLLLREYFPDKIVAWTVILIAIGTNYLNYSAIDGAMTHNTVFTLAALLLWSSHRFYVRGKWSHALTIGACLGLMALTRPTEITA
ncbi:MAG: glycosyltransferase family 39 protein, partial [Bacteroidota bacterium]